MPVAITGNGRATLSLGIPGDSRLVIDQIHLRPAGRDMSVRRCWMRSTMDVNAVKGENGLFVFLVNYNANESADVHLGALGTIREAVGLRAGAILVPVQDISPETDGARVTVPPAALVRVTIG